MPLSHSFTGGAVVDEREPNATNRRKKQLKRANEAASNSLDLAKSRGYTRRQALALYGSRADKKATDPRRRNKKKAIHARNRDRDIKLDVLSAPCAGDLIHHAPLFVYPVSDRLCEAERLGEEERAGVAREDAIKAKLRKHAIKVQKAETPSEIVLDEIKVKTLFDEVKMEKIVQNRGLLNVALSKVRELVHEDAGAVDEKLEERSNADTSVEVEKSDVSSESSWTMA